MDQSKHFLIFTAYYPPHLGGVERYTQSLAHALIHLGQQVTIVTSSLNSGAIQNGKVSIVEIPSISLMNSRFPVIIPRLSFFRSLNRIQAEAYDAIIINTRYYPISLLGCHIARKQNLTPIVIDHSSGYLTEERSLLGTLMRAYERVMTRIIQTYKPSFYSVSNRSGTWLKRFGIKANGILPNSIDAKAYHDISSQRNWRRELKIDDCYLVIYAGRLVEEKGVLKLIEAVKLINMPDQKVFLAIAGSGNLEKQIIRLQNRAIKYVGSLSSADLSSLLEAGDIFCLPTTYPEGLPTVLLEAAAQKCAIIVSDTGGTEEVVPNDSCGVVLRDTSPVCIANSISKLIANPVILKTLQQNVFEHVDSHFSWIETAYKTMQAVEELSAEA